MQKASFSKDSVIIFFLDGAVHETIVVPGGLHAALNRFSTSHLSALAMEKIGTCVAGLRCNWLLHHNHLGLR
jgi:hypothetical protein